MLLNPQLALGNSGAVDLSVFINFAHHTGTGFNFDVDIGCDEVGPKQADFTRNGRIDAGDLGVLTDSWLTTPADIDWYVLCDLYADGKINFKDFARFVTDYLWEF